MLFWLMCMAVNTSLTDVKVLVTRPKQQSDVLEKMIKQRGGQALMLPVIDVQLIPIKQACLADLAQQDMIVFISKNAVLSLLEQIDEATLDSVTIATVGLGTAEELEQLGVETDIVPMNQAGSESLLALEQMQNVHGKKITIVRGRGGRELLASELRARGATVTYIEAYERVIAAPTKTELAKAMMTNCTVCTSVAGVENLIELVAKQDHELLNKPLIVVSERIKSAAKQLGFKHILVTSDIGDTEIVTTLIEMEL